MPDNSQPDESKLQEIEVEIALPHSGERFAVTLDPFLKIQEIIAILRERKKLPSIDANYLVILNDLHYLEPEDSLESLLTTSSESRLLIVHTTATGRSSPSAKWHDGDEAPKAALKPLGVPGLDYNKLEAFPPQAFLGSQIAVDMVLHMHRHACEEAQSLRDQRDSLRVRFEGAEKLLVEERQKLREELVRREMTEDYSKKSTGLLLIANLLLGVGGGLIGSEEWGYGILFIVIGLVIIMSAIHLVFQASVGRSLRKSLQLLFRQRALKRADYQDK